MSRREWTNPYPRTVDEIEFMVRDWKKHDTDKEDRADTRDWVRMVLADEYGARRPRYSLIRFLKAHR